MSDSQKQERAESEKRVRTEQYQEMRLIARMAGNVAAGAADGFNTPMSEEQVDIIASNAVNVAKAIMRYLRQP